MLVGRIKERAVIEKALSSKKAELIAIYGRRRVGKTHLVREVLGNKINFELVGLHGGNQKEQIQNFTMLLNKKMKLPFPMEAPKNWLDAFARLETYIESLKTKKKIIFIDEFPWIASRKTKFLMAFENFWNSFATKRKDIVIIISGSAAAWMIKNIIYNKGGLHNRITHSIRLLPFTLSETEAFLKKKGVELSRYDIIQIYMVLGGVPFYLDLVEKDKSVAQIINHLILNKDAKLKSEFEKLFASLFENEARHMSIIKALASTKRGLTRNEISTKTKTNTGGTLTRNLKELLESGFISYSNNYNGRKSTGLYRLIDEYSLFYLKFIDNHKRKQQNWSLMTNTHSWKSWSGFSFEMICLKHVDQIKKAMGVAIISSEEYNWKSKRIEKGAQIDLIIDRADNVITLFEIKFSEGPFTISKSYAENLRNKKLAFRTETKSRKSIFIFFLSTFGLEKNKYARELIQQDFSMNILFQK
ncbi:MAG: ATP-binding protein [Bacteroidota bacterium]